MLLTAASQRPPLRGAAGVIKVHSVPNLDRLCSGIVVDHRFNTLANSLSVPTNVVPLSDMSLEHRPFRIMKRSNAAKNSSIVNPRSTSMCTARVA